MAGPDPIHDDGLLSAENELRRDVARQEERVEDQSTLLAAEIGESALEAIGSGNPDAVILIAKTDPTILAGAFAIVQEAMTDEGPGPILQNDPGANLDLTTDQYRSIDATAQPDIDEGI